MQVYTMGATGEICLVDVIRDQFFQLDFRHFTKTILLQFWHDFSLSSLKKRESFGGQICFTVTMATQNFRQSLEATCNTASRVRMPALRPEQEIRKYLQLNNTLWY